MGKGCAPNFEGGGGGKQIPWARQAQQKIQEKCDWTWPPAATDKEFACAWTTPARLLNFEFCFGDAPLTSPTNPHLPTLMLHGGSIRVKLALCNFGFARCCRCNAVLFQGHANNHLHAHKSQSNMIYNTFCSLGGRLLQKWYVLQHNRPPVSRKCCK